MVTARGCSGNCEFCSVISFLGLVMAKFGEQEVLKI